MTRRTAEIACDANAYGDSLRPVDMIRLSDHVWMTGWARPHNPPAITIRYCMAAIISLSDRLLGEKVFALQRRGWYRRVAASLLSARKPQMISRCLPGLI